MTCLNKLIANSGKVLKSVGKTWQSIPFNLSSPCRQAKIEDKDKDKDKKKTTKDKDKTGQSIPFNLCSPSKQAKTVQIKEFV